jgi:hypothetical protein
MAPVITNDYAKTVPIVLYANATFQRVIRIRVKATGLPKDLTGAIVDFIVKKSYNDATPIAHFILGTGITVDPINGAITLGNELNSIPLDKPLVYDMSFTLAGRVVYVIKGTIIRRAGGNNA